MATRSTRQEDSMTAPTEISEAGTERLLAKLDELNTGYMDVFGRVMQRVEALEHEVATLRQAEQ
jgi:hypothetical protein